MKRFLILIFIMSLSFSLIAEQHGEDNAFSAYSNDPSFENFHKAVIEYTKLAETDPTGHIMLSYLYQMEMEKNIEQLSVKADSLDMGGKFSYANLLLSLNRNEEAVKIYEAINAEAPAWSCPWRHKGEALYKSANLEEAEKATKSAIETKPDHFDAYIQLAHIQFDMDKKEEALATMELGLTQYSEDCEEDLSMLDVNFFHLKLLKLNGKKDAYKKLSAKLREIAPENSEWDNFK